MSDETPRMTSHRPYLLRALYEWIAENGMTPHLLVDAMQPSVQVPLSAVKDGKVVLNIAGRAVTRLELGNEAVTFTARFGGVSQSVMVPIAAVLAIYARETGQGMALPDDIISASPDNSTPPPSPPDHATPAGKRAHLRIIK
ncbi:MAG: ClpXP protease specificity-enhancing factor [Lysobacter sp.]|nr:ClpXP protease specificity-enhancing factor [Lysobacter sp.]